LLALVPADWTEESAAEAARRHRPELQEITLRRAALEKMLQTGPFGKKHDKLLLSTVKQLRLKEERVQQLLEAGARKAFQDFRLAAAKKRLAEEQLSIAAQALAQVQASHRAGFSSNKEVLDGQSAHSQAQINDANALIDLNLSQIRLLFEMGQLRRETLL
jgi:hypothetical protein